MIASHHRARAKSKELESAFISSPTQSKKATDTTAYIPCAHHVSQWRAPDMLSYNNDCKRFEAGTGADYQTSTYIPIFHGDS